MVRNTIIENLLVIAISLGGASWCGYLYYKDVTSKSSGEGRDPAGVLSDKQQSVKRKFGDKLIWDPVDSQDVLYWNDSIRTAQSSKADITLDDGNKIVVGESSLVVLERDNDHLALNLKSGDLFVDNSKATSTKKAEIKINGQTLKQADGEKVTLHVDHVKGEIKATSSANDGTAKEIVIDKQGHVEEKVLPAVLNSPDSLSQNYVDSPQAVIKFAWTAKAADHRYLEIAADREFRNIKYRSDAKADALDMPIAPGSYFWRVRLTDKQGEAVSEVRSFTITQAHTPELLAPATQTKISFKGKTPPPVEFTWKAAPGAAKYLVEIAATPNFKQVVARSETVETVFRTADLKEGSYSWRVSALYGSQWKPAAPMTLELTHVVPPPAPQLATPAADFKLTLDDFEKNHGMLFTWKGAAGDKFRFVLAHSEKLTDEVTGFEVDAPQALLHETVSPGTYYWAVAHKDDNDQWKYTEARKIEIAPLFPLLPAPAIVGPVEKSELDLMDNPHVLWSWKSVEGAKEYKFKLYKLVSGKIELVSQDTVQTLRKEQEDLPDGNYKWLVSSVDQYGRESKPIEHDFKVIHGKTLEAPDFEMQEVQ